MKPYHLILGLLCLVAVLATFAAFGEIILKLLFVLLMTFTTIFLLGMLIVFIWTIYQIISFFRKP